MFSKDMEENAGLDETLGGRIIEAREAGDLTTAQLARRIGVKSETLGAWESDRSEPRPNQLVTISGMLNVSPTWLLTGTGESPSGVLTETEMEQIRSVVERLRGQITTVADELDNLNKRLLTYQSYQD